LAGDRPQHRAAARTGRQRIPGCRHQLPLFLRPQDDVRALCFRVRGTAGRLRHRRRADRMPDAGADREDPQDSDHSGRRGFLEGPDRLDARQAGRGRTDFSRRHGPDDLDRRTRSDRRRDLRLLREPRIPADARRARQDAQSLTVPLCRRAGREVPIPAKMNNYRSSPCNMRLRPATLLPTFAFVFALAACAQKPPPANLEPLPEAPPPPPEIANDPELEPQVTIVRRPTETIEEYRVKGRLTMIKVIPKTGRPYYLVADGSDGTFVRRDSLDTGFKVPMWL